MHIRTSLTAIWVVDEGVEAFDILKQIGQLIDDRNINNNAYNNDNSLLSEQGKQYDWLDQHYLCSPDIIIFS